MRFGIDQYENHYAELADELEREAGVVVHKTIARIHQICDVEFSQPKTGVQYRVGGTADNPIMHQASAPGEPPAMDTGALANSGYHMMTGKTEGEIGFTAEYAIPLEMGTVNMRPRPFLVPAVEQAWPEFVQAMGAVLGR